MTIRQGRESGLKATTGRCWPASITVRSPAWRARGISPLESRIWTGISRVETGTAAGAGAGEGAAWRSAARRADAVITLLFYGPVGVDVRYKVIALWSYEASLRPQLRHHHQKLLQERPQQGELEERDQPEDQLHRALHEEIAAAAARRAVVDPEEDDPHVVDPEQVGERRGEVGRQAGVGAVHHLGEQLGRLAADRLGVLAERVEGARRVRGRLEEDARELVVGHDGVELGPHHAQEALAQALLPGQDRAARLQMLLVGALVEGLDQVLLGAEVVIGVPHRHAGPLGDGAHGGLVVPPLPKEVEGGLQDLRAGALPLAELLLGLLLQGERGGHFVHPAASPIQIRFLETQATSRRARGSISGSDIRMAAERYFLSAQRHITQALAPR